jgi:hypothetical protein
MDVKLGAAINVDLTLDQTMSDAKVKQVFLDAAATTRSPAPIPVLRRLRRSPGAPRQPTRRR